MGWQEMKGSRRLGQLECLERPAREQGNSVAEHVILFHGFGADAYDLLPLADVLDPEGQRHWLFPMGHLSVPIAPGFVGRAWWKVDIMALQNNPDLDRSESVPEGLPEARNKVDSMLKDLMKFTGIDESKIYVGGFSQGSMITCDLAMRTAKDFAGLLAMSGTLICKKEWELGAIQHSKMKVFMSHGKGDPVLPFKGAERLLSLFQKAGISVDWVPFSGTHEIPPMVLQRLQSFLNFKR